MLSAHSCEILYANTGCPRPHFYGILDSENLEQQLYIHSIATEALHRPVPYSLPRA